MTEGTLNRLDLAIEPDDVEYVIPGIAIRGAVSMIAGEAGGGKSLFTQYWARRLVREGQRVTVVDGENGPGVILRRLKAAEGELDRNSWARLKIYTVQGFDLERERVRLTQLARHCDLLVLDSWVSLWQGSEGSVKKVKACLEVLRQIAQAGNCAIILIHHTTKAGDTYRGSSAIAATIEAVFTFTRVNRRLEADDGMRRLHCTKMRLDEEPPDVTVNVRTLLGSREGADGGRGEWAAYTWDGVEVARGHTMDEVVRRVELSGMVGRVNYGK